MTALGERSIWTLIFTYTDSSSLQKATEAHIILTNKTRSIKMFLYINIKFYAVHTDRGFFWYLQAKLGSAFLDRSSSTVFKMFSSGARAVQAAISTVYLSVLKLAVRDLHM